MSSRSSSYPIAHLKAQSCGRWLRTPVSPLTSLSRRTIRRTEGNHSANAEALCLQTFLQVNAHRCGANVHRVCAFGQQLSSSRPVGWPARDLKARRPAEDADLTSAVTGLFSELTRQRRNFFGAAVPWVGGMRDARLSYRRRQPRRACGSLVVLPRPCVYRGCGRCARARIGLSKMVGRVGARAWLSVCASLSGILNSLGGHPTICGRARGSFVRARA
jgi:hypothetical protein